MIRYCFPSDDEQLAGQWQDSHFDEDAGWWVSTLQAGATFALAAALTVSVATTAAATSVFSQSQDDPAGNLVATQLAQEEYWQNPVAPVNWPQPSVFTADETLVPYVATFVADDGDWRPLVLVDSGQVFLRLPFLDPDEIPVGSFPASTNPVDDSSVWVPQIPASEADTAVSIWLDDGSWVPAFEPDEDFLPSSALPAPWNWPQPQQPFAEPDENYLVQEFVAAEEPFWLQLVPPTPASLLWPQPWQFEQHETATLTSFTDEVYWQNPVQPVPDAIWLLRQDAFEQTDATGALFLDLEEGLAGPLPVPVADSLRLLQPFLFDQHEPVGSLTVIHEEDFWQNPVPPANWPQPFVFIADEQIFAQPTAIVEEAYWIQLVQPVADSLYQRLPYVPDPEEIPAGSLVPFIPPPPQFCPLPPAGPDADTSMSTFSNFKGGPILALFCRICKSGKPLIVRADYAIWCQDCCAFVSKQDTYMGTVQAPGQFRGRF